MLASQSRPVTLFCVTVRFVTDLKKYDLCQSSACSRELGSVRLASIAYPEPRSTPGDGEKEVGQGMPLALTDLPFPLEAEGFPAFFQFVLGDCFSTLFDD